MRICADEAELSGTVAALVAGELRSALATRGTATVALPGGTTPRLYLPAIARLPLAWQQVVVTLTDERRVPATSADSNEGWVRRCLSTGSTAAARFVGWQASTGDSAPAVREVDARLHALTWPLDLVLLGVGEDGHVASLFPGQPDAAPGRVVATVAPRPPHPRLSLTFASLASARRIIVVAAGPGKRVLLERVIAGLESDLPIGRLQAAAGDRLTVIALS